MTNKITNETVKLDWKSYQPEIILLDKKTRHLENVYDHILDKGYSLPVMLPLDLMNCTPATVQEIYKGIEEDFGKLDILLHNAAELGSPSPLDQYDYEYWQKVMQTNLQAPYFLTKELLPLIKNSEQGQILFTSAQSGRSPAAYWGAYGIAYAGIEAQMKTWAEELENPTNLLVNSIDPGAVRTSFRRRSHPGEIQETLPSPQEITNAYIKVFSGIDQFRGERLAV